MADNLFRAISVFNSGDGNDFICVVNGQPPLYRRLDKFAVEKAIRDLQAALKEYNESEQDNARQRLYAASRRSKEDGGSTET